MNAEDEREAGGSKGRIWVAAVVALAVALVAGGALLAANRGGSTVAADPTIAPPKLSAAEIYPSLAEPKSPPKRPDYAELFVGQTLAQVAGPACPRYREIRRAWWARGQRLRADSVGADASPRAAARYYAGVVWVSQDEAGEFRNAITRISRSRVSAATRGAINRGFVVNVFTTDALELCGLSERYRRTYVTLDRLDLRISRIIALARRNSSSGTEANVQ